MFKVETHYPHEAFSAKSFVNHARYDTLHKRSSEHPDIFWAYHGTRIDWMKPFSKVKNTSFEGDVSIKWFEDGTLNVSANCIDRHLAERGEQTAIIWEGDNPAESENITYNELHKQVCLFANMLKANGVKKGDVVTLYMPMIPEAAYAMLACTRIGAPHSVVFGGFSPEALAGRINDCKSKFVVTADQGYRSGKTVPLKANVDAALEKTKGGEKVFVVMRTGGDVAFDDSRDIWVKEAQKGLPETCEPEEMKAEDPLFILYTSGSTGTPKGVLHTTGGYLVYASMTHKYVFDHHDDDIFWCTADVLADRLKRAMLLFRENQNITDGSEQKLIIAGGVAANKAIAKKLTELGHDHAFELIVPPANLCTDNGAMIAWAGITQYMQGNTNDLTAPPRARWPLYT